MGIRITGSYQRRYVQGLLHSGSRRSLAIFFSSYAEFWIDHFSEWIECLTVIIIFEDLRTVVVDCLVSNEDPTAGSTTLLTTGSTHHISPHLRRSPRYLMRKSFPFNFSAARGDFFSQEQSMNFKNTRTVFSKSVAGQALYGTAYRAKLFLAMRAAISTRCSGKLRYSGKLTSP